MASSTSLAPDGQTEFLHPRPKRPSNSQLLRPQNGHAMLDSSAVSSGRSTPIPEDAPPSIRATSSARRHIRAQQKQRLFPTIEYAARVSHFDRKSEHADFRGFFVLFWVGLVIMVMTGMLRNFKETGYPIVIKQWPLFIENIWEMAASDAAMVLSMALTLPLHKLYAQSNGFLRWSKGGRAVQSIFQAIWLAFWVVWPFVRNWTWTAQVFFLLHNLSMFMKIHSYAFYNGHLSETRRRLDQLDKPEGVSRAAVVKYPTAQGRPHDSDVNAKITGDLAKEKEDSLIQLREALAYELTSPLGHVTYPANLTIGNFVDYVFCPTLCYELEYPRTPKTDWLELFYKTLAVFGCIFLITLTTEEFVLPVLDESAAQLSISTGTAEGSLILAETISRLLFPFMVTFLLVFLVIFEYLLGAFAEITRSADRRFYSDWWNSCDWLEFSREWNIPVHNFLNRHVYSAPRDYMSRNTRQFITFFISALAHELIMGCITKKLRGYGFVAMMLQGPIVMVQRSKFIRGRTLLNNVLFWCSMILGLSMICALYVLV